MLKSLTTEWSWLVILGCRRPVFCAAFCASLQTFCGAGRLLPSALPRQTLHEATCNSRDDDDAHKQGRGHPDNQGDEEQVSNWRGNPERHVEGFRGRTCGELCFYQLILQLSNIQEQLPKVSKSRSVLPPGLLFHIQITVANDDGAVQQPVLFPSNGQLCRQHFIFMNEATIWLCKHAYPAAGLYTKHYKSRTLLLDYCLKTRHFLSWINAYKFYSVSASW